MSKDVSAAPDSLKTALKPAAERKQVFRAAKAAAKLEDKTVEEFVAHVTGQRQLYAPGHRKNWSKGRMKVAQAASVTQWMQSESPDYRRSVSSQLDQRSILANLMGVPDNASTSEIIRDAIDLMRNRLAATCIKG